MTDLADPERALVVTYAPSALRRGLAALFALDEKFGEIVATTTEPMIGLVRLAWWREALETLDTAPTAGEPLLQQLAGTLSARVSPATLAAIEDGWAAMLDGGMDADAIARHGRERGGALFRAAADWLGAADADIEAAGAGWALADLGHRHSDATVRETARAQANALLAPLRARRWSRAALPLAALATLAARDAATTGARRQGSPARLLRLLALRLTRR